MVRSSTHFAGTYGDCVLGDATPGIPDPFRTPRTLHKPPLTRGFIRVFALHKTHYRTPQPPVGFRCGDPGFRPGRLDDDARGVDRRESGVTADVAVALNAYD